MAIQQAHIAIAAEGINRIPDLSPLARRLAHELINRTDKNRGYCYPSEARLAAALGCDERSIRRAKVELRERGFLTWQNRGRSQTPLYRVMFAAIVQLAHEIKRKIRQASQPVTPQPTTDADGAISGSRKKDDPDIEQAVFRSRYVQGDGFFPSIKNPPATAEGTKSSAYPSPVKNIKGFWEKGAGASTASKPPITPEQALKNAEKRFWADLMKLPRETFIALTAAMTPEQQAEAVKAEAKWPFGNGINVVLDALKAGGAA